MNHQKIIFNAELSDNEIKIKLTADNGDRELAIKAASKLFASLEKVGIEAIRKKLENDWHLEPWGLCTSHLLNQHIIFIVRIFELESIRPKNNAEVGIAHHKKN